MDHSFNTRHSSGQGRTFANTFQWDATSYSVNYFDFLWFLWFVSFLHIHLHEYMHSYITMLLLMALACTTYYSNLLAGSTVIRLTIIRFIISVRQCSSKSSDTIHLLTDSSIRCGLSLLYLFRVWKVDITILWDCSKPFVGWRQEKISIKVIQQHPTLCCCWRPQRIIFYSLACKI